MAETNTEDPLAEKVRAQVAQTGAVSSATVASAAKAAEEPEALPDTPPLGPDSDPLNRQEKVLSTTRQADIIDATLRAQRDAKAKLEEVRETLTEAQKRAYKKAMVNNERYQATYTLFGTMEVTFRCRSHEETEAIYAYLQRLAIRRVVIADAQYAERLMRCQMVAQVASYNGQEFDTMRKPLLQKLAGPGDTAEPLPWEAQMEFWADMPEPMIAAINEARNTFEAEYWAMTDAAADANFWQSETSS